jgi:hypothetical protein
MKRETEFDKALLRFIFSMDFCHFNNVNWTPNIRNINHLDLYSYGNFSLLHALQCLHGVSVLFT